MLTDDGELFRSGELLGTSAAIGKYIAIILEVLIELDWNGWGAIQCSDTIFNKRRGRRIF